MKKNFSKNFSFSTVAASALLCFSAFAQSVLPTTDGEIRKIDLENKKITLKHGEIKNLDMPAMTMVFAVKDPAMLEAVKAGDKVTFTVDKLGSTFTVMSLEKAK